jgi:hypothetical protein
MRQARFVFIFDLEENESAKDSLNDIMTDCVSDRLDISEQEDIEIIQDGKVVETIKGSQEMKFLPNF